MLKRLNRVFLGLSLGAALAGVALAGGSAPKRAKRAQEPVKISVVPVGPTQTMVDAARARAEQSAAVQEFLKGANYRYLDTEFVAADKSAANQTPNRFRAIFYDYTNDRTIVAESDFEGRTPVMAKQEFFQPIPSEDEFAAAKQILAADGRFKDALEKGLLKAFRPMPPVTVLDGTPERLVNIGLDTAGAATNEIVSVSLKNSRVIRYDNAAPPFARVAPDACGVAASGQATSSRGTAGQYQMTVTQGATTLWEMLVIRPAASSGTNASGIEVRDVKYKGKSVMKVGHAPVLDVQYINDVCGPYRDWQYAEDMFQTPATGNTDPAPGIRILAAGQTAKTELEAQNDTGNFRGVAIYTQDLGYGNETILVSEMQAGWYRYIMEWRFANDGTIRPRYGFGATSNNCVCSVHNHHVYWRFDFDIVSPTNRIYQIERGRKFQQPILTEMTANKNTATTRSLIVQNSNGDEAYLLVPNLTDGVVDAFGAHDFWVLRNKSVTGGTPVSNEIDDGRTCCGGANQGINIDSWANGESVVDQDLVVWYGAHFVHADSTGLSLNADRYGQALSGSHVIGPDLRPVRW